MLAENNTSVVRRSVELTKRKGNLEQGEKCANVQMTTNGGCKVVIFEVG